MRVSSDANGRFAAVESRTSAGFVCGSSDEARRGARAILDTAGRALRRIVAPCQVPDLATARISALITTDGLADSTTLEPADGGMR